ncbi:tRNA A64-2'-O-ribosylphosphate transferase [Madurella fahalii]|uniref:tRNA A64-2'-O-ribosylphosphate transferase n=1 Tax=Madurella fahalii TaxID=1157608 RepID=A0ABQ0G8W3_9PEZI
MPPPTLAEVIFPEQANHSFSRILGDLKRSNLSITNRLRSIRQDASFVEDVAAALKLPLVANERCGSWYIDPALKAGSAYFKSTDGHTGQWKFSTRRLNLHLLELIGKHNGCIIIDSTRRGKRMPDALSKTLPTWCSVLNRVLFPDLAGSHGLVTPGSAVSASEASQIEARLPGFVASFRALAIDPAPLRERLGGKPLRPFWVTPPEEGRGEGDVGGVGGEDGYAAMLDLAAGDGSPFHPVVCCTSSRRVVGVGAEIAEGRGYIQGAGDDTENWAMGLTPAVFWRHQDELLAAAEGELPGLIARLLSSAAEGDGGEGEDATATAPGLRRVASGIGVFVGTLGAKEMALSEGSCVVTLVSKSTERATWVKSPTWMEVGLGKSKAASRSLRDALPQICEFVSRFLRRETETSGNGTPERKVVILCESGKDLSVGVALAIYCWCFDPSGNVRTGDERESFNKTAIRVKLGHIMTTIPDANPSRATLQSVNSYLMDWRK